ncbi:MAG TPA: ABC transporter permease [Luteitalea sp.]|nr:ABC transporter permease [Luteitalea sp.]
MAAFHRVLARVRALWQADALDDDFAEELAADLELRASDYERRGLSPTEARRQARRDLGSVNVLRDDHRSTRSVAWLDHASRDVRTAARALASAPVFTMFAVVTLALGLGASAAVYSLVHALLVRPLPFADPSRLIWVANIADDGVAEWRVQVNHLRDLQASVTTLDGLGGYYGFARDGNAIVTVGGQAERFSRQPITRNFLDVLGVAPALGRGFTEAEAAFGGPPAVLLSHHLWTERFDRAPDIVGRTIVIDGRAVPVVGVLPQSFEFSTVFEPGSRFDLFVPFPLSDETNRSGNTVAVVGRVKAGVSVEAARAELQALGASIERAHPERNSLRPKVLTLSEHVIGHLRPALLMLGGAVLVVMLIVCANLANLQLARAAARRREMALRAALGASAARLVAPAIAESLLLAGTGAAGGVVLAMAATRLLAWLPPSTLPLMHTVGVDVATVAVLAATAAVVVVLIGALPAIRALRHDAQDGLRDGSRGNTGGRRAARIRGGLVVAEVTLACLLLIGATLLVRSFLRVMDVQLGFRPDGAVALRVDPERSLPTQEARNARFDAVLASLRSLQGVDAAGLADVLPLDGNRSRGVYRPGQVYKRGEYPEGFIRVVTDGYASALGLRIVAGRDLAPTDRIGQPPVALVNETMARTLWPGEDAIGQLLMADGAVPRRVVGIVGDVRHRTLEQTPGSEVYLPLLQTDDYGAVHLVVRGSMPTAALVTRVRQRLAEFSPTLPTNDVRILSALVDRAVSPRRFLVWLLTGFAGFAAVLAALGIYAVVSYTTAQRRAEFGVRLALGATSSDVQQAVVWQAVRLALLGVAAGTVAAILVARVGRDLLFGVEPTDLTTFVGVAAGLLLVAMAAAWLPARAAARVTPLDALRSE